jgi:hypothetical protein
MGRLSTRLTLDDHTGIAPVDERHHHVKSVSWWWYLAVLAESAPSSHRDRNKYLSCPHVPYITPLPHWIRGPVGLEHGSTKCGERDLDRNMLACISSSAMCSSLSDRRRARRRSVVGTSIKNVIRSQTDTSHKYSHSSPPPRRTVSCK